MDIRFVLIEIENRIADDLSGTMICYIATAINVKQFRIVRTQFLCGGKSHDYRRRFCRA